MAASSQVDWKQVLGPLWGASDGVPVDELDDLEKAAFQHAPRAIRWRSQAAMESASSQMPWRTAPVPWYPLGELILEAGEASPKANLNPGAYLHHAAGQYYVQDAGSMLAIALCRLQPGETVVDTCASPGGKSTAILESLQGQGCLIANEVISGRLSILQWALERAGFGNHAVTNLEVDRLADLLGPVADCVLVDAPCSGQSMVAKGKQTTASYSEQHVEHCAARQQRILRAASQLVKPSGRLVYSTCTFAFQENEQVLMDFLHQYPNWRLVRDSTFEQWENPHLAGTYRLWPHRDATAGTFVGVLQQSDGNTEVTPSSDESVDTAREAIWHPISEPMLSADVGLNALLSVLPQERCQIRTAKRESAKREASEHFRGKKAAQRSARRSGSLEHPSTRSDAKTSRRENDQQGELHLFPGGFFLQPWSLGALPSRVATTGTRVGTLVGDRFEPSFGSSKCVSLSDSIPSVVLKDQQASLYVQGQSLRLAAEQLEASNSAGESLLNGWVLVTWRGCTLSWGKLTGETLKNHFPKVFRQHVALAK